MSGGVGGMLKVGLGGAGLADLSRKGNRRVRSPALCTARSMPGHTDGLGARTVQDACGFPYLGIWGLGEPRAVQDPGQITRFRS